MREDYEENLDKMFPLGYVIVYTNPDLTIRLNIYNPNGHEILFKYHDKCKELDK